MNGLLLSVVLMLIDGGCWLFSVLCVFMWFFGCCMLVVMCVNGVW